jgi:hypothetical protein
MTKAEKTIKVLYSITPSHRRNQKQIPISKSNFQKIFLK